MHPIDASITIDDRFGDRKAPPDLSMENREKKYFCKRGVGSKSRAIKRSWAIVLISRRYILYVYVIFFYVCKRVAPKKARGRSSIVRVHTCHKFSGIICVYVCVFYIIIYTVHVYVINANVDVQRVSKCWSITERSSCLFFSFFSTIRESLVSFTPPLFSDACPWFFSLNYIFFSFLLINALLHSSLSASRKCKRNERKESLAISVSLLID